MMYVFIILLFISPRRKGQAVEAFFGVAAPAHLGEPGLASGERAFCTGWRQTFYRDLFA